MMKPRMMIYIVLSVILLGSPLFLDTYWVDVLNSVGLYAILGLSLNLIVGHTGLFNLGHAAFYAVGAYTAAILNTRFQIPILWLIPVCGLSAGLFAAMIARPIIHLRGDYLCIVTIGVGEIVRIALINDLSIHLPAWIKGILIRIFGLGILDIFNMLEHLVITGGANGIFGISRPTLFGLIIRKPEQFFYLIWFLVALTVFLFDQLEKSRFGRALNYLRDDDVAAEGSGIDTSHYKLAVFVLGAAWAGMTGNIFAAKMTIIAPESFSFWESVVMFTLIILGGSGSIPGVILGAFLLVGLPEAFRGFANARMLVFGAAMVGMMIFRNQGILPPLPRTFSVDR